MRGLAVELRRYYGGVSRVVLSSNRDECYFLEDIGLFPKSRQIFEKLVKARCNLDRFHRKCLLSMVNPGNRILDNARF